MAAPQESPAWSGEGVTPACCPRWCRQVSSFRVVSWRGSFGRAKPEPRGASALARPATTPSAARKRDEPGSALEAGEAVPGEVDEVRRHLVLLELAAVQPPLTGQGHHPDEHLRVDRRRLGIEPAL